MKILKIPCYTCIHILGKRCKLYDLPILYDIRFCDGYINRNNETRTNKSPEEEI